MIPNFHLDPQVRVLQYATLQQFEDMPKVLIPLIDNPMIAAEDSYLDQLSEVAPNMPSVSEFFSKNGSLRGARLKARVAQWVANLSALKPRVLCAIRCITATAAALPAGRSLSRRDAMLAALDGFEGEGALVLEEACRRLRNAPDGIVAAALGSMADSLSCAARHPAEEFAADAGSVSNVDELVADAEALLARVVGALDHRSSQPAAPSRCAPLPVPVTHSTARAAVFRRRSGGGLRVGDGAGTSAAGFGDEAADLLRRIAGRVPATGSLPLREAVALTRPAGSALRPVTSACPRHAVQEALLQPARYLRAAAGEGKMAADQTEAAGGPPDVCRLYSLAASEGPRFSGPEWLRAFRTALRSEHESAAAAAAAAPKRAKVRRRGGATDGLTEAEAEGRFREAGATVELVGLVGRSFGGGGDGAAMVHLVFPAPPQKTGVNRNVDGGRGGGLAAALAGPVEAGGGEEAARRGKRRRSTTEKTRGRAPVLAAR